MEKNTLELVARLVKMDIRYWEENRETGSILAIRSCLFPPYAQTQKIKYENNMVRIPFEHDPIQKEMQAIAGVFVDYVTNQTGDEQTIQEISEKIFELFVPKYFIKPNIDNPIIAPNYRIEKRNFTLGVDHEVIIQKEPGCKYVNLLERFAESVKPSL